MLTHTLVSTTSTTITRPLQRGHRHFFEVAGEAAEEVFGPVEDLAEDVYFNGANRRTAAAFPTKVHLDVFRRGKGAFHFGDAPLKPPQQVFAVALDDP